MRTGFCVLASQPIRRSEYTEMVRSEPANQSFKSVKTPLPPHLKTRTYA